MAVVVLRSLSSSGREDDWLWKSRSIGVFDLESGSIGPTDSHDGYSDMFWPPPAWVGSFTMFVLRHRGMVKDSEGHLQYIAQVIVLNMVVKNGHQLWPKVPVLAGSNGTGVPSAQQAHPLSSATVALSMTIGLNMAKASWSGYRC